MDKALITYDTLKAIHTAKGYIWRDGIFDLNIGGIRATYQTPDLFDDYIYCAYLSPIGEKIVFTMMATTKPGDYWLTAPMNPLGTFIMKPGQYIKSHIKGLHYGKPAFVQFGDLTGWRDNNRDHKLDFTGKLYTGNNFAVNIHRMGTKIDGTTHVKNQSAGCQGGEEDNIEQLLYLYQQMVSTNGRTLLDYTLLEEVDFA